jgi:hypothetical protein
MSVIAGAANLTLMSLNIRDGLKMTGNKAFKSMTTTNQEE